MKTKEKFWAKHAIVVAGLLLTPCLWWQAAEQTKVSTWVSSEIVNNKDQCIHGTIEECNNSIRKIIESKEFHDLYIGIFNNRNINQDLVEKIEQEWKARSVIYSRLDSKVTRKEEPEKTKVELYKFKQNLKQYIASLSKLADEHNKPKNTKSDLLQQVSKVSNVN